MQPIYLVTRGDDAGSCVSADLAVREAAERGILRNASVMVPGPSFQHAAETLREVPGLAIGLHVVLNAEWDHVKWGPVAGAGSVPGLVDGNGHFLRHPGMLHERGMDADEAMHEVRAQLRKARDSGLDVSYVDEHMGVGWVSGLSAKIKAMAEEEGLFWHRRVAYLPHDSGPTYDPKAVLLDGLERAEPGRAYVFVNHPGADAPDMRAFGHEGLAPGQIAAERELDRLMWSDPEVLASVERRNVQPIRYIDVPPECLIEE